MSEGNLARFSGIFFVEAANEVGGVFQVFGRFPSLGFGGVFVSGPADEVFESPPSASGIEDFGRFIFVVSFDFDRRWR